MKLGQIFTFISIVLCVVAIHLYQRFGPPGTSGRARPVVASFDLPQPSTPDTYPVVVADYREVRRSGGDLRIFGRTLWHDSVPDIGGQVAVLPVELVAVNVETGDTRSLHTITPSRVDGNFLFTVAHPVLNYRLVLHIGRAEGCPAEFRSMEVR